MIGRYSVAYCWGIYRACARPWVLPQHYVHVAYLQEGKFIVAPLVGERRLTVMFIIVQSLGEQCYHWVSQKSIYMFAAWAMELASLIKSHYHQSAYVSFKGYILLCFVFGNFKRPHIPCIHCSQY